MRPALALAVALTAWSAPSHAQDPETDYRAGVAARLAGDPAAAADRLSRVVAAQPDNADAHLQLGLALSALDRTGEAEAAFRRTLDLAPDYHDARIGLARLAQRRGDRDAARALLAPVPVGNADADILRGQLEAAETAVSRRWQFNAEASYTFVEGGQPDWQELWLSLRRRFAQDTSLVIALQGARRFDRTDVYAEATIDHRLSHSIGVYLLAGGTPGADFRPEWQVGAGASWRLSQGGSATVAKIDGRLAHYPSGDIATVTPGVEQYFLGGRGWITLQWINTFGEGEHRSGWLARGDLLADARLRLFGGIADAPDVSEGFVVDTLSLFGGAAWTLADGRTLSLSLARDDRDGGPDRLTISLGLGLRF